MPQLTTTPHLNVDLTRIENAEVRRAVRQLVQQLQETIARQQVEIEALLELMLEKHIASLSEFRRQVQRVSQHATERNERVHSQAVQTVTPQPPANLQVNPREADVQEEQGRQVYRL